MNESDFRNELGLSRHVKQAFVIFAIIGAFFVIAEHRAHLIPYLPWLLLLACPLMHLFMHHGHGDHKEHAHADQRHESARSQGVTGDLS